MLKIDIEAIKSQIELCHFRKAIGQLQNNELFKVY